MKEDPDVMVMGSQSGLGKWIPLRRIDAYFWRNRAVLWLSPEQEYAPKRSERVGNTYSSWRAVEKLLKSLMDLIIMELHKKFFLVA